MMSGRRGLEEGVDNVGRVEEVRDVKGVRIQEGGKRKVKVKVYGLVSRRSEKVVESVEVGGLRGFFKSIRPKAYWESMGIIPWFTLLGVVMLTIKLLRVATGNKESEQDEGPRRSMAAVTTEEDLKQLHEFKCGGCGYVMYPARGREFKFFPDSFRCPLCQSPKSEFWDLRDPDDPRNQEVEEEEEQEQEYEVVEGEGGEQQVASTTVATVGDQGPGDQQNIESLPVDSIEGNGDGNPELPTSGVEETGENVDAPQTKE